ncbi:DUF4962 domain-containing protein [Paenibacillus antri]|uniref:DUF4962 domain-containing protein n=1 Tax=Paenibacillus antri TaxID=2582848 RepID=A0A5R9G414_9BACL|nr:DUF4962 domain-containing protein [Paenibacillus antri]TLS49056.1 DUF4962 domain-containing protein [Paenibacillus antri]
MRKTLFEPISGPLTVQYAPTEETELRENPPRFTWMGGSWEDERYALQLSTDELFQGEETVTFGPLPYNFYTPDRVLAPGTYYWRYALWDGDGPASDWSRTRRFRVAPGLPETPLPSRADRYAGSSEAHPRLWLDAAGVEALRARVRTDADGCGWTAFYERSVLPWAEREQIAEPARYPDNKRVASLWRRMYMDCQETLYAIRHLAVAGVVLQDEALLAKAKAWLLHAASWDPDGTTSRDYNDEAAFRVAGALAWGYDWLHGELTDDERRLVRASLLRRTEQVAFHVIDRSKIHHVPYDSHAVRSLSSVLTPCCIALLHEEEQAKEWLDYAIDYFACLYSPWGGADGGWAEGPMYWTTGMAFVTEAMGLLKAYVGIDLYRRPFFRKTGDFPLYCFSPDTTRASFGDQSTLGDLPSLKTGALMRLFAGQTGNPAYRWYYDQVRARESPEEADTKFYNYGWWDFRFDELVYRHEIPDDAPGSLDGVEPLRWFRDVGWVAMHHRMDDPAEHVVLLAKSSPYGSISHSHGDQNGFLLHAYGEPLAIDSGYYVAFGSTMHLNWRRQTRSKNAPLIDGRGQYAGRDKSLNLEASGRVEDARFRDGVGYARMDATAAYRVEIPYAKRVARELYFVGGSYVVVVDLVDLEQPGRVTWQLHALREPEPNRQTFRVDGEKAELAGKFVYCSSGELRLTAFTGFEDVEPSEIEGLAPHARLLAETKRALSHRIVTLLVPAKKGEPKLVSTFLDDQDHGVHLYFTEHGVTKRIEVPKAY